MGIALKHHPASNTAAVITVAALDTSVTAPIPPAPVVVGPKIGIEQISWSYDGAPTSGNLKIESPSGTTLFSLDITSSGPGFIPFSGSCFYGAAGQALIITLAAGGGGVTGKLNAIQR